MSRYGGFSGDLRDSNGGRRERLFDSLFAGPWLKTPPTPPYEGGEASLVDGGERGREICARMSMYGASRLETCSTVGEGVPAETVGTSARFYSRYEGGRRVWSSGVVRWREIFAPMSMYGGFSGNSRGSDGGRRERLFETLFAGPRLKDHPLPPLTKGGRRCWSSGVVREGELCADEHVWREQVGNLLHDWEQRRASVSAFPRRPWERAKRAKEGFAN
jgi:hypothetical protein